MSANEWSARHCKSKYFSSPFFKIVLTNPSTQGVILHEVVYYFFQDELTRPVLVHTWQHRSMNVMCSTVFWFECTKHVSPISVKWINLNSTNSANNCQTATVSFQTIRFNQLFYVFTLLFKTPNHVLIYWYSVLSPWVKGLGGGGGCKSSRVP